MSRLFLSGQGTWKPLPADTIGIALYSFTGTDEHQVSFIVGEPIKLEEETVNWYRGRVISTGKRGIFPQSFVCIKNTEDFDIVTNELTQVIREWGVLLISYFKDRKINEYKIMKDKLSLLLDWHSKILSPSITLDVREMLKGKVISKIEEGRRLMGLDMIVRTPNGEPANEKNTGIIQLYRMHQELDTLKHSKYTQQQSQSPQAQLLQQQQNTQQSQFLSTSPSGGQSPQPGSGSSSPLIGQSSPQLMPSSPNQNIPSLQHSLSGDRLGLSSSPSTIGGFPSTMGSGSSSPSAFIKKNAISKAAARKSITLRRETSLTGDSVSSAASMINNNYQPNQLFLDLKIFMCSVGEKTELYFSIYNKNEGRFITEEYQVGLTAQGMPHDIEKIGKLSTLFIDISKKELTSDLYLVCRLIRTGKMLYDSNKKAGTIHYRRPFGCSVLKIEDNVSIGKEMEHTIPIYTSTGESTFPILHEMIIKNPSNLQAVPKAKGICVGLTLLPGDLKQVIKENPVLEEVSKTNKLGFPEVIFPGETRNDIFITLDSGEYSQDRKTSAKNVEVIIQARLEDGELVKDCLFYGDKLKSEFKSIVFYHSNQPHWVETFRVNVPISILDQVYLVFSIRHCTTSENKERTPFAMSYLKLTNPDGTVIANKTHSIPSYKTSKSMEEFLPSLKDPNNKLAIRKNEQTKVRVLLCSTMCTQNLSLLTLLKWDQYHGDLAEVLNRFTFVDQIEIIKFMQETFNALFAILETKKISDPDLVFNAITWIIGLLVDEKTSRYTNFRPVLDIYIENHFTSKVAHILLIGCLKRILSNNNFKTLMSTLKSMEYILKFIVTSKKNSDKQSNNSNQADQTFKQDLTSVFSSLSTLMKRTEREYIGTQTTALKIFSSMFNDLGQLFSLEERSRIAINFVDSVIFEEGLKILNMEKMNVILNLTQGDLFLHPTSRVLLMPMVKKHLKQHMMSSNNSIEDTKKHAEIISVIIESIQSKLKDQSQIWDVVDLLPEIMKSIQSSPSWEFFKLDMIHNLYSIVYLMEPEHFDKYIKMNPENCWTFLLNLLTLLNQLLSTCTTYPENWLTLSMFQYSTVKKVIIQVSQYLLTKLQSSRSWTPVDQNIWSSFFSLSNTYFKLKGLALENFSEAKQNTIKSRYGDMRNDLIGTIQKMWTSLDKYQIKLLPTVISPFLELMLINQQNLKLLGIDLYYQLLRCEFREYKSFKKVETETINTLDQITNTPEASDILDEKFRIFFSTNLDEKMNGDNLIKNEGKTFIKDMTMFLELLYELRTLPDRPEYEDDRTIAAMQLMAYLKQTDRQDTYFKYVHLLCNQHLGHNNYVEAGNTLLLHADSLQWSDEKIEDLTQSKRERKERLFKQAIEYFDKGKAWEKAIGLMKQLIVQYEEVLFDYQKLADILQQESTFYRKVIGVERFFSEYFRVGYYGKGFDPSIQGKEFIYKGYELERMADFVQRIQGKFPSAKLLTYTELPPLEILNSTGQYLQIYAVKPVPQEEQQKKEPHDFYSMASVGVTATGANGTTGGTSKQNFSPAVTKFRQNNNINTFLYSKPFKKNKSDKSNPSNEFKDLWITNYYYFIQDTFPTIHRRSEIIKRTEIELAPIDNAVNSIIGKNVELIEMIAKHEHAAESNTSHFTMVLKGVIDAAVNGGVNLYKEVFFSPEYLVENPTKKDSVDRLKLSLSNQVAILEKCLLIHLKVMSQEMSGLQEQLEIRFKKMKTDLEDILK
ncbi:SH3 domain-containing protein [Tieghemostelium lacteum]|uniref:SH3 domain-containing protein n=1 Tax=Tieghemostelium lacteum TaxID=361077 RepID=A0A151Z5U2_TIELA|nr:SH3 domain-containing protein [Tieghemostelium lacteum]|eukprot:KYQ89326.1 SH3 domain-containing protein [Tieghemostelium lacteum]